jgi:hypothetical protein
MSNKTSSVAAAVIPFTDPMPTVMAIDPTRTPTTDPMPTALMPMGAMALAFGWDGAGGGGNSGNVPLTANGSLQRGCEQSFATPRRGSGCKGLKSQID